MAVWQFNRGEWTEAYVFMRLLGDGRIYGASSELTKDDSTYIDIINIIREEPDKMLIFERFVDENIAYIKASKDDESTNPIGANILLCAILCLFYFVLFMFRNSIATPLLSTLMKICFLLEGCLLINISFCFIYYAWGHLNNILFIKAKTYFSSTWRRRITRSSKR